MRIKEVPLSKMNHVFRNKKPRGLFLAKGTNCWLAMDNRNNHPHEMAFSTREAAEKWLNLCDASMYGQVNVDEVLRGR